MAAGLIGIGVLLHASGQEAKVYVVKPQKSKISLDPTGLQVARTPACGLFREVLLNDLRWSGWFELSSAGAACRLLGQVDESGGNLSVECQVYDVQRKIYRFGRRYDAPTEKTREMAHAMADRLIKEVAGHPGMCLATLALVGQADGTKEIYKCDYDGANLKRLTHDNCRSVDPHWNPQGTAIYYTSDKKYWQDLYVIDLVRHVARRVSEYPGLNTGGAVSPNGREMAVILSKDGNVDLYIKNLATGQLTRLTRTPNAAETSPAWSPDGNSLVYCSDQAGRPQLYVISRRGGTATRLTSRGTENVAPDWGANGLIACASKLGPQFQICVINPDSEELKTLTNDGADYEDPAWMPDGRHLACSRTVNYQSEIWLVDLLGDPAVRLGQLPRDINWSSPACTVKGGQ